MRVRNWGAGAGRLAVTLVMAAVGLSGATIVSTGPVTEPGSRTVGVAGAGVTSWSNTSAYQNVSISAWLSGQGNVNGPLEAYVTTQIGPGATAASQVASTVVTASLLATSSSEVPLFSGLTLPAGTYYLVLYAPNDFMYWGECTGTCTPVTAADAALLVDSGEFVGSIPAYRPSADFAIGGPAFSFSVTGTLDTGGTGGGSGGGGDGGGSTVPEPSTFLLAGAALPALALAKRIRRG